MFVNNAGITRDASLKKMTVDQFDAVVTVHLRGTWLGVREASAVMREAKTGSIVNISSLSGKSGNPGQTNYSAAKAGIVGLTKAAAKELAHHNVRVNAVQPGLIRTPMTAAMPPEVFAEREAAVPMKRAGEPAEVAGAVVFLASESGQLHHRYGHRSRRRPIHMTPVSVSVAAGVGSIVLNRPEHLNAVNVELAVALEHALVALGSDTAVNVVLIRGANANFCAGGDFAEVERLRDEGPEALRGLFEAFRRACDAIATVGVPVVAAVEGVAAAGGFELMQAADIVLVSDDARIADNHVRFGMIPGGGSTQRLPRLVGRQQALGMLLSGDRLSGTDAVRLGLAYRSVPPSEFNDATARFVATMAGRERSALMAIKRLVVSGMQKPLATGLDDELAAVVNHISQGAGRNGASAFSQRGASQ